MIIYKLLHSKLKIEQHELFKENGRVGNSYSTSGTRHVPVKQREYQLMQLTWHPFTCHWVTIEIAYLQLSSIVYDSPLKTNLFRSDETFVRMLHGRSQNIVHFGRIKYDRHESRTVEEILTNSRFHL